jgi:hypothetical protein
MDLYGNLAHSEFDSDLLVEETASYPRHNLLSRAKGLSNFALSSDTAFSLSFRIVRARVPP